MMVYDLLKLRDGVDCATLPETAEVRDELIALAEGDRGPSYVPMRAAGCLIEVFPTDPATVEHARAWVTETKWTGLGMLVGDQIDRFSVSDAVDLAKAAVGERVLKRMGKSGRREVVDAVEGRVR